MEIPLIAIAVLFLLLLGGAYLADRSDRAKKAGRLNRQLSVLESEVAQLDTKARLVPEAHEVMTGVVRYVSTARAALADKDYEDAKKYVKKVETGVDRVRSLLSEADITPPLPPGAPGNRLTGGNGNDTQS